MTGKDAQLPSGAGEDHLISGSIEHALVWRQHAEGEGHGYEMFGLKALNEVKVRGHGLMPPSSSLAFFGHLRGLGLDFLDVANEVESLLRQVIKLTGENLVEATDGFLELHILAGHAGEDFSHKEGL